MMIACERINHPTMPYKLMAFDVFFKELSCLGAIAAVLDKKGKIRNFPGNVRDERWKKGTSDRSVL